VGYFKFLSKHIRGGTKEDHERTLGVVGLGIGIRRLDLQNMNQECGRLIGRQTDIYIYIYTYIRGAFEKFVDSPYYSVYVFEKWVGRCKKRIA
jgi:hypothetical protein